jgi:exodeoxyribonuclease VII large subunit
MAEPLRTLDPRAVLARGYSMTLDRDGHILTDANLVVPGAQVQAVLARGTLIATVNETVSGESHERPRKQTRR